MDAETNDGRRDFDFLLGPGQSIGRWTVHHRVLAGTGWVEFEGTAEVRSVLGGLGNVDAFSVPQWPGHGPFEGMSLRLFEPATGLWRIWWSSDSYPGRLDPPVIGRFTGRRGEFHGADETNGKPFALTFTWEVESDDTARWEQAFSYDDGHTWETNWIMGLTRR